VKPAVALQEEDWVKVHPAPAGVTGDERLRQTMLVDAMLPAAGRISGEFAAEAGAEVKALIEIGGRTVLQRTLETLRATDRIGKIVVIGPEEVTSHPAAQGADALLSEGGPTAAGQHLPRAGVAARGERWPSRRGGS